MCADVAGPAESFVRCTQPQQKSACIRTEMNFDAQNG